MFLIQVTTRDIPTSQAIESHVRQKAEKLKLYYNNIIKCRIVIEMVQKHKHQGKLYNVRIDLNVPRKELAVTHKCSEDVYIAIREAFSAISRRLEEHAHKRHGRVKSHNHVMHGCVARKLSEDGYGFIEGVDGNEYYFSLTNMSHPTFKHLIVGDTVEFTPVAFSDGLQAHHVVRERHSEAA